MANRDHRLHPFFRRPDTTPARVHQSGDRLIRTPPSDPIHNPWFNAFASIGRHEIARSEAQFRRSMQPVVRRNIRRLSCLSPLFPLGPPSPRDSEEEETPPQSPRQSQSPPRSPVRKREEQQPSPPPNSPTGGIPKHWSQRAEDNINMGFGFAYSWINTIKPSRFTAEERISLPSIYYPVNRKTLIMLVAHKNVEDSLFHKVEVKFKSQKKMKEALAEHFKLPEPVHRIRLSVSEAGAEVALSQSMIERFDSVEYFRLDTRRPDRWILHHIVATRLYRT